MTRSIHHQYFFPHPPLMVWKYLTNSALLERWLMKNNFEPIVGFDFQFRTNPIPSLEFDGIVYCKVLEIVPYEKLSYSWNSGPGDGKITVESIVTWILEPKQGGTELFLHHSGFAKEENLHIYNGLLNGWTEKLNTIDHLLKLAQRDTTNA